MAVAPPASEQQAPAPMSYSTKIFCLAAIFATFATPSLAQVAGYNDAGSYSSGYGMSAGSAQQPVNTSLRDGNGNLAVVNGQFTTSTMSQATGVQNLRNLGQNAGVGFQNSANGTASAIGNSLNVITTGSFNTVIVNSKQTNDGNQTATVSMNGH
jgi:holdfast attachment protein HfaA